MRTALGSPMRIHMMQYIVTALQYHWLIYGNYQKWTKFTFLYIENDLKSNSIKYVCSQFIISTIPEKLHAKIEDNLLNKFWMNGQFVSTSQKRGKFVISDIRRPLLLYNDSIKSNVGSWLVPSLGRFMTK